ncbi:MAG: DNA polymerase III subunit delta [Mariprofundaceae bacterium]
MKLSADRAVESDASALYLYGEDADALFEAAELLLAKGDPEATRLRVDVSELARIETESKSQGLFGPSKCYALVRNAESASPKQGDHLLKMVSEARPENRLIICAPGIAWKKALHKKMQAHSDSDLAQCEFHTPSPAAFQAWLAKEIKVENLNITDEALQMMGERLHGLRAAARQLIERLRLYDDGQGESLGISVVGDLLGERSPEDLEAYCHAVAKRDSEALILLRRLICDQQVAEVQIISWLGTRMNQLLMYCWYQAQRERNPLQKARVFGAARQQIPGEARAWKGKELSAAIKRITEAEKLIKGASIENNLVVLERMTIDLLGSKSSV